ncbi:MAG: hypothetical protein KY462_15990 [Actinobacteria bacterium]|nr:hypothetical protein [Actinomycetota bacterium]
MRTFRTLVVLRQPVGAVWTTMRDRLPELVPMIDDVDQITTLEREELTDDRTRLVNEWQVRQRIPELLRGALPQGELGWIDRNIWDDDSHLCTWQIEPFVLPGAIRCEGSTSYESAMAGRGCRVLFEGSFDLSDDALSALAAPLRRPATRFVETIVTTLIPRNTRSLLEAAAQRASEDAGEPG